MRQQWNIELKDLFRTLDEWDATRKALEEAKASACCFLIALIAACCTHSDWGFIPAACVSGFFLLGALANACVGVAWYSRWRRSKVKSVSDVLERLEELAQCKQDGGA